MMRREQAEQAAGWILDHYALVRRATGAEVETELAKENLVLIILRFMTNPVPAVPAAPAAAERTRPCGNMKCRLHDRAYKWSCRDISLTADGRGVLPVCAKYAPVGEEDKT